jgi:hypothetical protein
VPAAAKFFNKTMTSENQFEHPCQGQQAHDKNDRDNPQNNFHFLSPSLIKDFSCNQYRQKNLSRRFTQRSTGHKFSRFGFYLCSAITIATPPITGPLTSFYSPCLAKIQTARQALIVMRVK